MFAGEGAEGLVGALQNALRADVYPAAGRHLAVHDQAFALPGIEVLLRGPGRDHVRVRDEDARRVGVGAEHRHGLARLDQERFIGFQAAQGVQDGFEGFTVPGGLPPAAVYDEVVRIEGDLGIQVVLDHAVGRFDEPVLATQPGSRRCFHDAIQAGTYALFSRSFHFS